MSRAPDLASIRCRGPFFRQFLSFEEWRQLMVSRTLSAGLLFLVAGLVCTPTSAQFDELLNKTPATANSIFLINVDKVLQSPAAAAGNWKTKAHEAYATGVTILPPDASQAVLSAHFDLESMTALWEAATMQLKVEPALNKFAQATKGAL